MSSCKMLQSSSLFITFSSFMTFCKYWSHTLCMFDEVVTIYQKKIVTSTITKVLCSPLWSECFILLVLASMYCSTHKSVVTVSYLVPTQERSESPNLCLSLVFIPLEKVLKQSWTLTLLALFLSLCLIMMFHHFLFLFPVSNIYSFFCF